MCAVSMVGDYYSQKWQGQNQLTGLGQYTITNGPSQIEFDSLKKEVLEMKELLKRAKIYDEKNGEPDCELEEKIKTLRKVADLVGVSLDDVFKKNE